MDKLKLREKLGYSCGSLGNNLLYGLVATFLVKFYTDYMLLPAISISILFVVARIWDGINDPFMGFLVDKTNTKHGQFRPYLLFMPFFVGLFAVLCFYNPGFSQQGNMIWAYVTYILFGMAFTAMDIPYWSMTPTLTQSIEERSSIVSLSRTIATVGYFIAMVVAYPIMVDAFGGDSMAWTYVAIIFAVLSIIFTLIAFKSTKERYRVPKKENYTLKKMVQTLVGNKPLLILMLSLFFVESANAMKIIFPTYYMENCMNKGDMISVLLGLYALATVLGSLFATLFMKNMGKRNSAILGVSLMAGFSIVHFVSGYNSLIMLLVSNAVSAFGFGVANISMMSMVADTVEYGQWKNGTRNEGMVFSTNIFKTKIATAIGGGLGALGLSVIGYQANIVLDQFAITGLHWLISLIPGVIAIIGIIPLLKYSITEDKFKQIIKELESK